MAVNKMNVELYTNQETINQILHETSGRGTSIQSLLHTASEMSKRTADAQPVNTSSRPVYTFSIAALLEKSTGCFITILKQNFRS
jgi:acetolactate synthase regulatory subunit